MNYWLNQYEKNKLYSQEEKTYQDLKYGPLSVEDVEYKKDYKGQLLFSFMCDDKKALESIEDFMELTEHEYSAVVKMYDKNQNLIDSLVMPDLKLVSFEIITENIDQKSKYIVLTAVSS